MASIKIRLYNQYFKIASEKYDEALVEATSYLTTKKFQFNNRLKKLEMVDDKLYFSYDSRQSEFIFPMAALKDVIGVLKKAGAGKDDFQLVRKDKKKVDRKIDFSIRDEFKLREYQVKYVDEVVNNFDKRPTSLIKLATGMGKSLISMAIAKQIGKRFGMIILPKFIDKWVIDIKKYTDISDDEICIVQGTKSLINLMMSDENNYKVIIFSMRTLSNLISSYEDPEKPYDYPLKPNKLMKHLGIDFLINDESHLEFYNIYNFMLYFNVSHLLGMTATFYSKDRKMDYIQQLLFPNESRIEDIVEMEKYIRIFPIFYSIDDMKKIQYFSGHGYSHILYEQSILRNSIIRNNYLEMIDYFVKFGHLDRMQRGDKMLIFCSTVDMCRLVANYLQKKYIMLNVLTYTQEDSYDNILNADICVSTVLSSGTALDIPNLITSLQTVAIDSKNTNTQALGRLRKIDGKEMRYYYFNNRRIHQHQKYHNGRKDLLGPIALEYTSLFYKKVLDT